MAFGFYYPTQAAPTAQWVPTYPPELPVGEQIDYPNVETTSGDGSTVYVQSKGSKTVFKEFVFKLVPKTDRDALEVFYDAVKKNLLEFELEDLDATLKNVQIETAFVPIKTNPGLYGFSVTLREV